MAEPTRSPSLPSTADATPYVPVSWMAVTAITVAVAFLITLAALGFFAFTNKKPLLMEELLALPAIAIVLSFAARRMIRNSEGTRTGERLANAAWWLAVVVGLCYVAYLFAIDYAIRRDARGEVEKWMAEVQGSDDDLYPAFWRTLQPSSRQNVPKNDKYRLELQSRDELLMFRNCDLVRLAHRNRGEFQFTAGAVSWSYRPGSAECLVKGTAKCPEGTFPVEIALRGFEGVVGSEGATVGRQWMVTRPPGSGFIDQRNAARTPYGWLMLLLETDSGTFVYDRDRGFMRDISAGPSSHSFAYRAYILPGGDRAGWSGVARDSLAQIAFAIPARAAFGDAGYAEYMDKQFFKARGGAEPTEKQKRDFFDTWNAQGIWPAGEKLKGPDGAPIDKENIVAITDTAVEARVPIEIPLLGVAGKHEVARGRLLITCTDPALMDILKRAKAAAADTPGTTNVPSELIAELTERLKDPNSATKWSFRWRVVRVESDMTPVNVAPSRSGGMPPGGQGGGPGG